ncbi:MAG: hypothetical protein K0S24_2426 [Sphingobacterium sp.]|jgi:mannosyltransferase OCH1-like enzyme|nr:hypothetical protein [Sphingobacterium sp.]
MQNKIIQGLWFGSEISTLEQLCIKSFLDNGHEFHLYVYDLQITGCPQGTTIKDANEIIEKAHLFKDVEGSLTSFANWFRYELLYRRGGWWVDMDVVCLKPFDFTAEYCFTTEIMFIENKPVTIVNNAIIKAPKNAEFLRDILDQMKDINLVSEPWGKYGSRFITKILATYESKDYILQPHVFCPINWHEIDLFFAEDIQHTFESSYAIHLWNNMWRRHNIQKDITYHPNSLIERLKSKYLGNFELKM